jgi:hypothetical protein
MLPLQERAGRMMVRNLEALRGASVTSALIFATAHNLRNPLAWFTVADFPLFNHH